jgi:hypothetical protein
MFDHISLISYYIEKTFQTNVVEKIKTHILISLTFFRNTCRFWDNFDKLLYNLIITLNLREDVWSYLAHFLLYWKTLQTNVLEELKLHILDSVSFFRKTCRLWDNIEKLLYNLTITLNLLEDVWSYLAHFLL